MSNFLNVTKGGPKLFLEQNLLRFPQSKSSSSVYGSAMHKAIEIMYVVTKKDNKLPSPAEVVDTFQREIARSRLLQSDEQNLLFKGKEKLANFYNKQGQQILAEASHCKTEVDFKHQKVEVQGAILTGKIDRLKETGEGLEVVDIKSGKAFDSFDYKKVKDDDYENIKKHNYKAQLLMYKVLLENSRDYRDKKVTKGTISFIDTDDIKEISIDLTAISSDELDRFKKLLVAVYAKITNLDFPDITKYESSVDGIVAFEEDLILGKV